MTAWASSRVGVPADASLRYLLLPFLLATTAWADESREVTLVAYRGVPTSAVKVAKKALEGYVDVRVVAAPLPKEAYYPPRRRYRADRLIADLARRPEWKVVGLTHRDISTTKAKVKDWGVFGLGYCPGRSAVVSTHRLGGRSDRLRKVVIHEFGHTLGLPHCPNRGCLMNDAEGSIRTVDRESGRFCPTCARVVARETQD